VNVLDMTVLERYRVVDSKECVREGTYALRERFPSLKQNAAKKNLYDRKVAESEPKGSQNGFQPQRLQIQSLPYPGIWIAVTAGQDPPRAARNDSHSALAQFPNFIDHIAFGLRWE